MERILVSIADIATVGELCVCIAGVKKCIDMRGGEAPDVETFCLIESRASNGLRSGGPLR